MTRARGLIFGLLFAMGLARVLAYLAYAAVCLPSPLETFHLEAKMVLLAYRAEVGASLYPVWRDYPHLSNFYGPAYFWLVGAMGSAIRADLPDLFRIGRLVTFGSGLLTSLVVGLVVGRQAGKFAGMTGAVLSLGAAPMIGFSVMVRPDLMAELLGVVGVFLAGRCERASRLVGVGLLVLAIFTKQTAAIFLLAAAVGWAANGQWRRGLGLLLGGLALSAAVGLGVSVLLEPNLVRSLAGDSKTPWVVASFVKNLSRAARLSPDLLYFPSLGLLLWLSGATGRREVRPAVLTAVLLAASLGLAAKRGADLNYYLSLRVVEGLAVGALWRAWSGSTTRSRSAGAGLVLAGLLGCAAIGPGVVRMANEALGERSKAAFLAGPYGREVLGFYREIDELARDPNSKVLTDSGLIDLALRDRASFGDPYLFRIMAETGQVDLSVMKERIDAQYYDLIVTTSELDRPTYESYEFGLPMPLVERARVRYARIGIRAGLFLFGRRDRARTGP